MCHDRGMTRTGAAAVAAVCSTLVCGADCTTFTSECRVTVRSDYARCAERVEGSIDATVAIEDTDFVDLDGAEVLPAVNVRVRGNDRLVDVSALRGGHVVTIADNPSLTDVVLPTFAGGLHVYDNAQERVAVTYADVGHTNVVRGALSSLRLACASEECTPSTLSVQYTTADALTIELDGASLDGLTLREAGGVRDLDVFVAAPTPRGDVLLVDNPRLPRSEAVRYFDAIMAAGFAQSFVYCEVGAPCEVFVEQGHGLGENRDPRD